MSAKCLVDSADFGPGQRAFEPTSAGQLWAFASAQLYLATGPRGAHIHEAHPTSQTVQSRFRRSELDLRRPRNGLRIGT
eukprot:1339706-Alexandrium_andersonii.AAC.1